MIAGYEQFEIVDKVTTGEKAVKVCRSCAVDLVFVEMQLPGISGAETGRLIRQFCPDTVIYGMTVCTSAGLIESIVQMCIRDRSWMPQRISKRLQGTLSVELLLTTI